MSRTPDDPAQDPIKALWQGQEQETPTMTVQAIRMLVKDNEARQRHFVTFGLGSAVFATSVFIWAAWDAPNQLVRIGDLVMLGWLPVMLLMLYRRRPGRAPGADASAQGLIDFLRSEIARQTPDVRLIALSMAPLAVGMAFLSASLVEKARQHGHWSLLLAIAAFVALWVVVVVTQIRSKRRRVAERLRELDAIRG